MRNFTELSDLENITLPELIDQARVIKKRPYAYKNLGIGKKLTLYFLNPSLRTRMSTQVAGLQVGMDPLVLDAGQGWNVEFGEGVTMDGDTAEHIREMAPVMGAYSDILAIRAFPSFQSKEEDYAEPIIRNFRNLSGVPIISLESATAHPLQALADMITIEEKKKNKNPKVVLTWAPHPKRLPQAVSNSFAEFSLAMDYDLTVVQPEGYELKSEITQGATISYDQKEACKDADFVYVKNWCSYADYGHYDPDQNKDWMVDTDLLSVTNQAKVMHCLPVRRNVVIDEKVLDSESFIGLDQAKNRVWSAQVVLKNILESL